MEHFLGLADEWFDVTRLHSEVPGPWRVHDVIVVLLRLRPQVPGQCIQVQPVATTGQMDSGHDA